MCIVLKYARERWAILFIVSCLPLVCSGCGNRMGSVEGSVTYDGQPIEKGIINFESADGQVQRSGAAIENGKYRIANISPGKKIVRIEGQRKTGRKVQLKVPRGVVAPSKPVDEYLDIVPAVYNKQSTLTAEVESGTNQLDYALEAK